MKRRSTDEFIEYARSIRTDVDFDYSRVEYINNRTKIIIIDPDFGEFTIKPNKFTGEFQGHPLRGCYNRRKSKTYSTEKFITKATSIRTDIKFDYSKVVYVHSKTHVIIIDPDYGEFLITPHEFLNGKGHALRGGTKRSSTEEFIKKSKEKHQHIDYDYSKVEYKNNKTKVTIIDPEYGEFQISPNSFLNGRGHYLRANQSQKYAYIHTISNDDEVIAIKYGIENYPRKRYKEQNRSSIYNIKPLYSFKFDDVSDCKNAERECKKVLGSGIVLKEHMSDGYTETTSTLNINIILDIYRKWGCMKINDDI